MEQRDAMKTIKIEVDSLVGEEIWEVEVESITDVEVSSFGNHVRVEWPTGVYLRFIHGGESVRVTEVEPDTGS